MSLSTRLLLFIVALAASAPAWATTYDVAIGTGGDNTYAPQALSIKPGDAVRFVWKSGVHPTMSDSSPAAWPMFTLSSTNNTQTITFSQPGTYPYHCTIHAGLSGGTYVGMIGTIQVQSALATAAPVAAAPLLSVFPNPGRGLVSVQLAATAGPDYKLRLNNVLGREVRLLALRPELAADGLPLDLSNLPAGLYFYSLLVNDRVVSTNRLTLL